MRRERWALRDWALDPTTVTAPEDRCSLSADCDAPFETTIVGWAGGTGWVFDACWPCALAFTYPELFPAQVSA